MNHHFGSPDPPRTLTERLARLNDNLQTLGERLKTSIAGVVGDAEINQVHEVITSYQGVGGLDIAMYQSVPVRGV